MNDEVKKKINEMCVWALVLGILSIGAYGLIVYRSYLGVLRLVMFAGAAIGIIGLLTFKPDKQRGRIVGVVGLVLSAITLVLSFSLTGDYLSQIR